MIREMFYQSVGSRSGTFTHTAPSSIFGFESRLRDVAIDLVGASAHVELPTVPRASDDAAVQSPLPQRTALMRAHAIERMKLSIDVEQRHDIVRRPQFPGSCPAGNLQRQRFDAKA